MNEREIDSLIRNLTSAAAAASGEVPPGSLVWATIALHVIPDSVDESRVTRWFGVHTVPTELTRELDGRILPVEQLGAAFERTASLRLPGTAKRDAGMYFTPADLADFAVEQTLSALALGDRPPSEWRVLDPAAGAGEFACSVVKSLRDRVPVDHVITEVIYLIDSDPLAVAVARSLLLARFGSARTDLDALERHLVVADSVVGGPFGAAALVPNGLDWQAAFPEVMATGGFDAVIGNPPWGTIKPSIRELAGATSPDLLKLDTRAMRDKLAHSSPAALRHASDRSRSYSNQLQSAGYQHQGKGDPEFYKYFIELSHSLLRPDGVLGLLVPSALQRASGAAPIRKLLLDSGSFELWLDFINRRGIFDIHRMFRFSLAVWRQGASGGIARIAFGLTSIDDARAEMVTGPVPLTSEYLAAVSPRRRTIPEVRTPDEAALYAKLHSAFPALEEVSAEDAWRVSFRREFDMTNDARHFVTPERAAVTGGTPESDGTWAHPDLGTLLPLYEGRMVHQFDAAAKGHVEGHGRSARWRVLGPNEKQVQPRYLVPSRIADQRGITREPRAAFCDITGHANERTVLAALIPANAACGNKVPTCAFDPGDPDVALAWLALANSFVIDWIARRRVSTTLNFFHWNELPLPRLDPHAPTGRELVDASRALSATPGRPWELSLDTRADLRADIDAAVAQLYGVSVREMALIMQDFPLLDRSVGPDQHRTVTRDLVLARLAAAYGEPATDVRTLGFCVARGEPTALAERVGWHLAAGAVGYIPGEHSDAVAEPA